MLTPPEEPCHVARTARPSTDGGQGGLNPDHREDLPLQHCSYLRGAYPPTPPGELRQVLHKAQLLGHHRPCKLLRSKVRKTFSHSQAHWRLYPNFAGRYQTEPKTSGRSVSRIATSTTQAFMLPPPSSSLSLTTCRYVRFATPPHFTPTSLLQLFSNISKRAECYSITSTPPDSCS